MVYGNLNELLGNDSPPLKNIITSVSSNDKVR